MTRQEIELHSPSLGSATIVVLCWEGVASVAYIRFVNKSITRLEAMEHGADLMRWFETLYSEEPADMPFDWSVIGSSYD